ncbi:MAG: amino acid ABC transporter permease, partial [Maritimibacter sp.]
VKFYTEIFQGTPLLMPLFLAFFGLGIIGIDVSPFLAASVALILWSAAFLVEIWRGCVTAIEKGQWEASASLGMTYVEQMRYIILPQALKLSVPPTVGFSVQVVKGTALTSIIGFVEVTKAGTVLANATFQPFIVYGIVALIYFALCYPLSLSARKLERKLNAAH